MMSTINGGHYQTISTSVSAGTPDAYASEAISISFDPGQLASGVRIASSALIKWSVRGKCFSRIQFPLNILMLRH